MLFPLNRLISLLAVLLLVLGFTQPGEASHPLTSVPADLGGLYAEYAAHRSLRSGLPFRSRNSQLSVVADEVMIDAVASGNVDVLKADLQALGMRDVVVFGR